MDGTTRAQDMTRLQAAQGLSDKFVETQNTDVHANRRSQEAATLYALVAIAEQLARVADALEAR